MTGQSRWKLLKSRAIDAEVSSIPPTLGEKMLDKIIIILYILTDPSTYRKIR